MKNVVLIGGAGFIGTRLSRRLSGKNVSFSIIDKVNSEEFLAKSHLADVRSIEELRSVIPVDAVIVNLAAEHKDDVRPKRLYDEVNVQGAKNICQVAEENGIKKIVFTSSVAVYGFAPPNTSEEGLIRPFNDYGRTKFEAEEVFKSWQRENSAERTLVIIRPTVVFGEQNRGNVYNLLRQIAFGKFVMIGNGKNIKSMAYVENVAAFLEYSLDFYPGIHIYNYIDKPDFNMNSLVAIVRKSLGKRDNVGFYLPYFVGYCFGLVCDGIAFLTRRKFAVSAIRIKKFCATTQFNTAIKETGFVAPVSIEKGLELTVQHEFLEDHTQEKVFFTE